MLHRHPLLSLLTLLYLGFVALVTLTPGNEQPDYAGLAGRVLARLEQYPELEPVTKLERREAALGRTVGTELVRLLATTLAREGVPLVAVLTMVSSYA